MPSTFIRLIPKIRKPKKPDTIYNGAQKYLLAENLFSSKSMSIAGLPPISYKQSWGKPPSHRLTFQSGI